VIRRTALLAFALAFPFAACLSQPPGDLRIIFDSCAPLVVVPQDATADEVASIDQALAMWNDAAATALTRELNPAARQLPVVFQTGAALFLGQYEESAGELFVNHVLANRDERAITIAYELGHAFGLPHVARSDRISLMNPTNLTQPLTAEDAEQLQLLWGDCLVRRQGNAAP
jgi:hypothetical protein